MKYEWQDKQNFVYLIDFVQFWPNTNFVGGAFEDLSASAKNLSSRDKPSTLVDG